MTRYHLNAAGEVGKCSAKQACPFGDLAADHYVSPEAARAAYEASMQEAIFTSFSNSADGYVDGETYEDEYGQYWTYQTSPYFTDLGREEEAAAVQYWDEEFDSWTTGWLNPQEANGLCTDSAEAFSAWANSNGYDSYVLDLNRDGGPHTVTVIRTPRGDMVVDFTYRQFDPSSIVPFYGEKEQFVSDGDWTITLEYGTD